MTLRVMTTLNFEKQVLSVLPVLKFFIYLPHMLTALKRVWKKLSFFFPLQRESGPEREPDSMQTLNATLCPTRLL